MGRDPTRYDTKKKIDQNHKYELGVLIGLITHGMFKGPTPKVTHGIGPPPVTYPRLPRLPRLPGGRGPQTGNALSKTKTAWRYGKAYARAFRDVARDRYNSAPRNFKWN